MSLLPEIRPLVSPLQNAVVETLEGIMLGSSAIEVGNGEAPGCPPPYLVVTSPSGGMFDGSILNPQTDAHVRIQVTAVGITEEQAMATLDVVRVNLTTPALAPNYAGNDWRIVRTWIDVPVPAGRRDERGVPNPYFSRADQYLIDIKYSPGS